MYAIDSFLNTVAIRFAYIPRYRAIVKTENVYFHDKNIGGTDKNNYNLFSTYAFCINSPY